MLQTMQNIGYVEPGSAPGSYRLSFRIVALGQKLIHGTNIIQIALPELKAVNEELGETVNLKVFHGDHSVILLKLEPRIGQVRTHAYMGMSVPFYLSATGKVFLAYRPESFVRKYWEANQDTMVKSTPFTITELSVFLERLNFVRENGYALDLGENEYGFACVAAPIFNHEGSVEYAVSITMTTTKLQAESIETFARPLGKASESISQRSGSRDFLRAASLPPRPWPQSSPISSPTICPSTARRSASSASVSISAARIVGIVPRASPCGTTLFMSNWTIGAHKKLSALEELMVRKIRQGPVIQMDETRVQVMKEPGRSNTKNSYMWLARGGPPDTPLVYYHYHPGRDSRFAEDFLRDYTGFLQTDGYSAYETALSGVVPLL